MIVMHVAWKQICAGFLLFVYICIDVGHTIIKRHKLEIPQNRLTLPPFSACSKSGLGFSLPCHGLFCVQCVEVFFVCFVDISGIVDITV